jgi:uncharacterized protein HemX
MENENKNEEKENGVVAQVVRGELTVKSLGAIAGIVLALLGALASGFAFVDNKYVSQELYDAHVTQNQQELAEINLLTAQLIQAMEENNQQEFNRIYKAIKDGTALPLIVRRDLLLSRSTRLTDDERTELLILETKLDELNITN